MTFCSFVGLWREAKPTTGIPMALGLLIAGVGIDTVSGTLRMTFGSTDLLRGINFLVAVIGCSASAKSCSPWKSASRCGATQPDVSPRSCRRELRHGQGHRL